MRIIAGKYRGRTIAAPPGDATRPILDRAKTVLFDMLGHRLAEPGRLPPLAVLDLYAGSGSLGIEALSRGARYCLFVERHRPTAALIRSNLDALGIIREAKVTEGDVSGVRWSAPPPDEQAQARYELVFLDPPYRLLEGQTPETTVRMILRHLATSPVIAPGALIVVRHGDGSRPDLAPLEQLEEREVGTMMFRFMTPPTQTVPDGPGGP